MKKKIAFILAVLLTSFFSIGQSDISFDEEKLLKNLETLSSDAFQGRKTGEKGSKMAREFIVSEFERLNVEPFGDKYEHHFDFETKKEKVHGINILGIFKGAEKQNEYIVVSAHYDHLGIIDGKIYNGADDDASGTSALFAFAEYLTKNPPKHSVILAAFDAEEMGLQGSKYFVDKMKTSKIVANVNMDMICRSSKNELYVVGSRYTKSLESLIENFKNPTNTTLLVGHDGADDKEDWTYSSDHGPFHKAGIPFLYFGDEDHPGYHKPTDDFKDISPGFYKNSVKIILSVFSEIDTSGLK